MRHRSGNLIFSPFCRIGSVRLLPIACDMVKLRGRFPHTHLEWRQEDEREQKREKECQYDVHRHGDRRGADRRLYRGRSRDHGGTYLAAHLCGWSAGGNASLQHCRTQLCEAAGHGQAGRFQCVLERRSPNRHRASIHGDRPCRIRHPRQQLQGQHPPPRRPQRLEYQSQCGYKKCGLHAAQCHPH